MNVVRVKPGVAFTVIAPGGFRILSAIDQASAALSEDLTITSACDGEHSGPNDPHHFGNAYDIRTHELANKRAVLDKIMAVLGWEWFFGSIEDGLTANEHIHVQVKKGCTYPSAACD